MRYWVDLDFSDVSRMRQRIKLLTDIELEPEEVQMFLNYLTAVVVVDCARLARIKKYDLKKIVMTWIRDLRKSGTYGLQRFPYTPGAEDAASV